MVYIKLSTILICGGYMVIGPTLILVNKYILDTLQFPYPMFLSGLGILFSGLSAQIVVLLGYVKLQRREAIEGSNWYKRILPIGIASAGTLALGNTAYLLLDVGFIQMLKSFVPVIIMITLYLFSIEYPTQPIIISVLIICIGIATTCSFVPNASILGIIVVLGSEVCESIRLVMTQYLLQNLKFGVLEGQYFLSPASAFWLFFASFIFEFQKMYDNNAIRTIFSNPHLFLAAASLGIVINYLTYFVIQATSSLTMKILGSIRNVFTILISVIQYNELVDQRELIGYSIAFIGFIYYTAIKSGYFEKSGTNIHMNIYHGTSNINLKINSVDDRESNYDEMNNNSSSSSSSNSINKSNIHVQESQSLLPIHLKR